MSQRSLFSPLERPCKIDLSTYCTLPRSKGKAQPSYIVRTGSLRRSRKKTGIFSPCGNNNISNSNKPADSSQQHSRHEFPSYILQTGCYRWLGRAYHRDSFMSHRREHVAEQGGESSGETLSKFKTRSNPPSIEEDHIPHLEAKHLSHTEASVHLDWDQQLSHLPSSLQLNHSDTVKDILRRPSSGKKELSSPPPVAPKPPYNRTLSERLPKDPGSVKVPSLSSSSFNVSNTHPSGEATVLSSSSTHIHASKSTPSLNLSDSQVLLPRRKFSQQPDQYKRQQPISEIIPSSSFEKWKRSMDSLDGSACSSLSHSNRSSRLPPPCEIRTSKSGTLGPSSSNHPHPPYSLDDRSRIVHHHHSRTTSLDQSAQQQQNMSPPPKHFHSNSDSGLSSLGGRTSTMSPVSTISSVSSGSSVSSRASLRSASIVSSSTLPGDNLIQEEEDSERTKEDLSSSNSSPHLSFQSGHVKKQKRSSTFQEEIDCEKVFNLLLRSLDSLPEKPSLDSLQTLFFTSPYQKTLLDYVEGVLEIEVNELFNNSLDRATIDKKESVSNLSALSGSNGAADPSASSLPVFLHGSNFETLKAELLKKVDNKLNVLRSTQILLKEDITRNEELGQNIAGEVKGLLSPIEYDKFSLHIQEMDKITNLLLGLSGRLARVENNLLALSIDGTRSDEIYRIRSEEGKLLLAKKDKLADQLVEAKKLKQNIDRRSNLVAKILRKSLSEALYAEYLMYMKNKTRLILDSREVYDKIKLGEEQVYALKTSSM